MQKLFLRLVLDNLKQKIKSGAGDFQQYRVMLRTLF